MTDWPDTWSDWDEFVQEAKAREYSSSVDHDDRPVVASRLVRGAIWFALAIMPARERWLGWLLERPHPIVQPHDDSYAGTPQIVVSLPSQS